MSTFTKANTRTRKDPAFFKLARTFYGDAFGAKSTKALSEAMTDWTELTEDEQTFTIAHLHYLGLLAQARTQKLLLQVRDLLDEVADSLGDVLEGADADDDGYEGSEEPEDDGEGWEPEVFDGAGEPEPESTGEPHAVPPEAEASPELDGDPGDDAGEEE